MKKKGFTLVELMVVIVIIGILIAIALPNFIASQDRAKISSLKSNMHAFQEAAETYAVDWGGIYPENADDLRIEGIQKNYWRDFKNPFTNNTDTGTSILNNVSNGGYIDPSNFPAGNMGYKKDIVKNGYAIYGADKETGRAIMNNGKPFFLTNS
jgi:general secretion pathway protein G